MDNLSSYYGLVDAIIRASEKDLPVNDKHLTQVAKTLGNFAETMLKSIRRKKKTSARSDVQSIQDSFISSGDIVRRAVNLVPQLQDSSPQGSTQDYLMTLKNIKKINRDFINALLVIRIQDSSQDSSQVSYQDSSQDSSSGSGNLVSPSNKILGANDSKAEHLTQAVETFGNFANTIFGSTRIKTRSGLLSGFQNNQDSSIISREGASGIANHGFQIDSSLNTIPLSISSDKSYIDVSNRDKVNLALANFQNLGVKGKVIY
jgi:hypothetical protein